MSLNEYIFTCETLVNYKNIKCFTTQKDKNLF